MSFQTIHSRVHPGETDGHTELTPRVIASVYPLPSCHFYIRPRSGLSFESLPPAFVDEFAYTARKLHDRSGLYYYRARFYSPEVGRFITQDPIGHLGGINLYAYVGNDPVNWVDPLGLRGLTLGEVMILRTVYGNSIDYRIARII